MLKPLIKSIKSKAISLNSFPRFLLFIIYLQFLNLLHAMMGNKNMMWREMKIKYANGGRRTENKI
jgi:hypothetical protein